LVDSLKQVDIRSFPEENMDLYIQQVLCIVDELTLTCLDERLVPDLATLSLVGLTQASDEFLRFEASRMMIQANDAVYVQGQGTRLEPFDVLRPLQQIYKARKELGCYCTAPINALQQRVAALETLVADPSRFPKAGAGLPTKR